MPYQFPDDETLVRYLALLRAAVLHAKMAGAGSGGTPVYDLLDAIQDIPDLLTRWPDMREDWVLADLEKYEHEYLDGDPRFSGILRDGAPATWRQLRHYPEAEDRTDPMALLRSLVGRWCGRRELPVLARLLPAMMTNNGLTDGWAELRSAVRSTIAAGASLPDDEIAELRQAERLIERVLRNR